jgi:PIN domain nuclease of toxin-antitoxin system
LRLLLDTCTFLWIVAGDRELSDSARRLFADAGNEVYLSAVSAWEISVKHGMGRLPLPRPPSLFVPHERARHGIGAFPLQEDAALAVHRLPPLHRDPFDRMLICQAIAGGMTILTPDALIAQYPVPTTW